VAIYRDCFATLAMTKSYQESEQLRIQSIEKHFFIVISSEVEKSSVSVKYGTSCLDFSFHSK